MSEPKSLLSARHWLVIDGEDDWHIEHDPACEEALSEPGLEHWMCPVGSEVDHVGLDSLEGWQDLAPGRYEVRHWSRRHPAIPGLTSEEWSAGLELVGDGVNGPTATHGGPS